MISFINGILEDTDEQQAVVDVNGIGFSIFMSASNLNKLPSVGEKVKIYTYMNVREDCMQLFGFLSTNERSIFKLLIGVNGIGPKGGLNILSVLSVDELCYAVIGNDVKALSKAPGIGKKTAERIIIELKDKFNYEEFINDQLNTEHAEEGSPSGLSDSVKAEAIQALVALGYSNGDAVKLVRDTKCGEDASVEDVLRESLKQIPFI